MKTQYKEHRLHENRESLVKEAVEHIEEPVKVPHSKDTYGKIPNMSIRGKK